EREAELRGASLAAALVAERIDITLPGAPLPLGHRHLISRTVREVEDIFLGLGYKVAEGPEIELDYYNFTALNTPEDHPARSVDDTFFIDERTAMWRPSGPGARSGAGAHTSAAAAPVIRDLLLRTQTSPVQVRTMESQRPPV